MPQSHSPESHVQDVLVNCTLGSPKGPVIPMESQTLALTSQRSLAPPPNDTSNSSWMMCGNDVSCYIAIYVYVCALYITS